METIIQTVIGVLIANKLIYVYQIWRTCSRYSAVEAYFHHVRLACRSAQRLELYRKGHRRPKPRNSPTTAWHILVVTPEEAEATIRMHCDYIFRHKERISVLAEEAYGYVSRREGTISIGAAEYGLETRKLISRIFLNYQETNFDNLDDCERLYKYLTGLNNRVKRMRDFYEKENSRITGENYLTTLISKPILRYRRISESPTS